MTKATTTQHNNDCLLGQGNYEYTPICQCNKCFVDPEDDTPDHTYQAIPTGTGEYPWGAEDTYCDVCGLDYTEDDPCPFH